MKKVLSIVATAALLTAASTAMAATYGTTSITTSKHNLSASGGSSSYKGTGSQICVYCHTPHNAYTTAPLWNRNNGFAANTYTLYSGLGMANVSNKSGF